MNENTENAFFEFNAIQQWNEALEEQRYDEALLILEECINSAKRENKELFVEHLLKLQQITERHSAIARDNPDLSEANIRERESSKKICSFCGKTKIEVWLMISGADGCICNECVDICNQIIASKKAENEQNK